MKIHLHACAFLLTEQVHPLPRPELGMLGLKLVKSLAAAARKQAQLNLHRGPSSGKPGSPSRSPPRADTGGTDQGAPRDPVSERWPLTQGFSGSWSRLQGSCSSSAHCLHHCVLPGKGTARPLSALSENSCSAGQRTPRTGTRRAWQGHPHYLLPSQSQTRTLHLRPPPPSWSCWTPCFLPPFRGTWASPPHTASSLC